MIIDMKKKMAKLLVDIPDELMKRIKHQVIDSDEKNDTIKKLVTNILEKNIKGSSGKSKDQSNIEKIMGKK